MHRHPVGPVGREGRRHLPHRAGQAGGIRRPRPGG